MEQHRKVCLITGSGSGNGRTMAIQLATLGYEPVIHHSGANPQAAQETCAAVEAILGRAPLCIAENLQAPGGIERVFEAFRRQYDRLDVYVNNSGITTFAPLLDMTPEAFDTMAQINWKSAFFGVQQAGRLMRDADIQGLMVLIASNHHRATWPGAAAYGSMKQAMARLVQYAGLELAAHGIRVNCLAPGYIDHETGRQPYLQGAADTIPLGRCVTSSALAQWVAFLDSPAALSLTGVTIDIDGGAHLVSGALTPASKE